MKIDLPLETWVDVFGFVPRLQLVQLVPHIKKKGKRRMRKCRPTIGDRRFVSFIQFYLHKCGEITLGHLEVLNSPRNGHDHPVVKAYKNHPIGGRELPLADVPISQNIKNFEQIHLRYFDKSVLRFLQELQQHSLLTNVNLDFFKNIGHRHGHHSVSADALIKIMANFMPLLTRIDSIVINGYATTDIRNLYQKNEYSVLVREMLKSTRFLYIRSSSDLNFEWYLQWLYTPSKDGIPRFLDVCDYFGDRRCALFVECIKKDFLEAKETAISFFVHFFFRDTTNVQNVTLENGKTQEKLVLTREVFGMSISRHPVGVNEKWIEKMNQYGLMLKLKSLNETDRKIIIYV